VQQRVGHQSRITEAAIDFARAIGWNQPTLTPRPLVELGRCMLVLAEPAAARRAFEATIPLLAAQAPGDRDVAVSTISGR
jgi:hypothetical protein